jgi:hypothetical protein
MFEKVTKAGDRHAVVAVARTIARLAETPAPPGVYVQAIDGGVVLSGRRLRRRMLTDPQLRNFGK